MDSIGDYLYIIVIIIAALSSILKKKKQNDAKNAAPKMNREQEYDDIILPEYFEELEKSKPFVQEVKFENEVLTYDTATDFTDLRAYKQITKINKNKIKHQPTIITEENEISENIIEFATVEDAQSAFIYSEIFNKKY